MGRALRFLMVVLPVLCCGRATVAAASAPGGGAPATLPAAAPVGPYEDQPLGGNREVAPPKNQPATSSLTTEAAGWARLVLSLAIVLGLIFALRPVVRRIMGAAAPNRTSRAIQVVSMHPIAPRQQLMLVRVGKRLVLVGNSGTAMNALCELTDPDEIASLLGQLSAEKPGTGSRSFGKMLGRAGRREERADPGVSATDDETQVGDDAEVLRAGREPMGATRDELSGLMEKVRRLSEQFER